MYKWHLKKMVIDLNAGKHASCGHTEVEVAHHLSSRKSVNVL